MEQFDERRKIEYGASELKKYSHRYSVVAFVLALAFHLLGVGSYWGSVYFSNTVGTVTAGLNLTYPRPMLPEVLPQPGLRLGPRGMTPKFGTPVPVRATEVDSTVEFPTQVEAGTEPGDVVAQPGVGGGGGVPVREDEPPPDFVPYESPPAVDKQVQPNYPELAMRAGLEGTVWVKIWIDKEGKPKKAVIQRSDAEIFNEPPTQAALKWVFVPAMMKSGPVSVWVSIPFKFRLQGK